METATLSSVKLKTFVPSPDKAPPLVSSGVIGWMRVNLFNSSFNSVLTVAALFFLYKALPPLISWAFIEASWLTPSPEHEGACWAFIVNKFRVLMVGLYPGELLWRPMAVAAIVTVLSVVTVARRVSTRLLVLLWYTLPVGFFFIINGGFGLPKVEQSLWGGLMLSMGLAVIGILFSLPFGILLALGRRSQLAVVRTLCTGIIECVRGVPLITILFMASVMLPIFLPQGVNINNLLRVQIGIILFSSAYMAEVVRGGLQAIPVGQFEAAGSLGLNPWQTMVYVVLPQALRHVVPSLIGRCVALFKDTSLVIIVGLLDFLGMVKASAQDPQWLGYDAEAYVFCAFVYWIICFSMSRYGRSIERRNQW